MKTLDACLQWMRLYGTKVELKIDERFTRRFWVCSWYYRARLYWSNEDDPTSAVYKAINNMIEAQVEERWLDHRGIPKIPTIPISSVC